MPTNSRLRPMAASAMVLAALGANARQRPNIVFIMTDDHTMQAMSAYDTRFVETPNLDRIAADGVKFTRSFVANSLSGPSRACMLTGKHSHKNGFTNNEHSVFDGSQPTFPKYLQRAGYQTSLIGKWHLQSLPTGFDHWEILPGQGSYYQPAFIRQQGDTIRREGYVTNIITDLSIDWLKNGRDKSKPFCLLIHHKAIHRNWMADTCHLALYEDRTFELPPNFSDSYAGRPAAEAAEMRIDRDMDLAYDLKLENHPETELADLVPYTMGRMNAEQRRKWDAVYGPVMAEFDSLRLEGKELAEWKYQRYMRDYLKTVKSLDENVGRVLDYLEAEGLADNTLVVYCSDQGFYMGEHGWFDKRFMYEESLTTPLVMKLPKGMDRRGDVDEMVQNIDYAPTFLDIAGVEVPEDMQGVSLLPLLKGEKPEGWRDYVYYHYYEYPAEHAVKRHYGVRTDRYKLMHFYNDIDHWELYDLQADPQEMHNIYGKTGIEEVQKEMHRRLDEALKHYDDPLTE